MFQVEVENEENIKIKKKVPVIAELEYVTSAVTGYSSSQLTDQLMIQIFKQRGNSKLAQFGNKFKCVYGNWHNVLHYALTNIFRIFLFLALENITFSLVVVL